MYNDIPLSKAMVVWNSDPRKCAERKPVCVIQHPAMHGEDRGYSYSDGACWFDWSESHSNNERLLGLLGIGMKMVVDYGISLEVIHKEFMNIPEYRDCLNSNAFLNAAGSMGVVVNDYFEGDED